MQQVLQVLKAYRAYPVRRETRDQQAHKALRVIPDLKDRSVLPAQTVPALHSKAATPLPISRLFPLLPWTTSGLLPRQESMVTVHL